MVCIDKHLVSFLIVYKETGNTHPNRQVLEGAHSIGIIHIEPVVYATDNFCCGSQRIVALTPVLVDD